MKRWIAILIALAPLYLVRFSIGGVPTTLFELVLYATVAVALGTNVIRWSKLSYRLGRWGWIGVILVLAGSVVGIVVAPDQRQALGLFKGFVVDPLLLAGLLLSTLDHEDLAGLLGWYLGSATLVSILSLIGWATNPSWAVAADGRLLGIYGLAPHASPNYLAFWIAPAVALGISWLVTPPWPLKAWERLIPVGVVLSMIALVGTASRAGIGAALLAGVIALMLYYRSTLAGVKYAQGLSWLLLIGFVAFGAIAVRPNFDLAPSEGGRVTASNNIRWEIWKTTGELLNHDTHWFTGVGLSSYQEEFAILTAGRVNYPEFITPWAASPHNLWLNSWVNQGLVGLVGVTLLIAMAIRALWRSEPTVAATLVCAVLVAILLQGIVDTSNWKNDTSVLFWSILAAAAMAAPNIKPTKR